MLIYLAEMCWLQKNNETLFVATEEIGHEVNAEKPEHMFMFVRKISTNFTT
jgi:hypothetical protein